MNSSISRHLMEILPLDSWRKAIAVLEVFGGGLGLASAPFYLWAAVQANRQDSFQHTAVLGTSIGFACLYLASVLAGTALWRYERNGRLLSILVQSLQVVQFNMFGVSYSFILLGGVSIYLKWPRFGMSVLNATNCELQWGVQDQTSRVGINLVALALVLALRLLAKTDSEETRLSNLRIQPATGTEPEAR